MQWPYEHFWQPNKMHKANTLCFKAAMVSLQIPQQNGSRRNSQPWTWKSRAIRREPTNLCAILIWTVQGKAALTQSQHKGCKTSKHTQSLVFCMGLKASTRNMRAWQKLTSSGDYCGYLSSFQCLNKKHSHYPPTLAIFIICAIVIYNRRNILTIMRT